MKTIVLLTTIILFQGNLLFAIGSKVNFNNSLAPVAPKEAIFEDSDNFETLMISGNMLRILAPSTPREATFEDQADAEKKIPDPSSLTPLTPKEADFNDVEASDSTTLMLPPSTPKEADFEEII